MQSIGLGGNNISDDGASHLAQALKSNTKLSSLGLGGNTIGKTMKESGSQSSFNNNQWSDFR